MGFRRLVLYFVDVIYVIKMDTYVPIQDVQPSLILRMVEDASQNRLSAYIVRPS